MYEELEAYIISAMNDYEDEKNSECFVYTEEEKKLMKEFNDCKSELMKILDEKQTEMFKRFLFCVLKSESKIKSEYFSQGFMYGILGLNDRCGLLD